MAVRRLRDLLVRGGCMTGRRWAATDHPADVMHNMTFQNATISFKQLKEFIMGKDRDNRFIKGLLVGGMVASLVTLLLAPRSGAEIRSDLMRRAKGWRSRGAVAAADMRNLGATRLQEAREHVARTAGTLSQRGSSMVDSVRNRPVESEGTGDVSRPTAQVDEPGEERS